MAEPLATSDDVMDVLMRPLTPFEAERVESLLDKASALFRQATRRTIDARMALFATNPALATAVDPLVVSTAVAGIVKRYLANVNGAVSTTRTAGPFSESTSFALRGDKDRAGGQMTVTQDDLAAIAVEIPMQAGSFMVGLSPALVDGMRQSPPKAAGHMRGIVASQWLDWNGLVPGQPHTLGEFARYVPDAAGTPR